MKAKLGYTIFLLFFVFLPFASRAASIFYATRSNSDPVFYKNLFRSRTHTHSVCVLEKVGETHENIHLLARDCRQFDAAATRREIYDFHFVTFDVRETQVAHKFVKFVRKFI